MRRSGAAAVGSWRVCVPVKAARGRPPSFSASVRRHVQGGSSLRLRNRSAAPMTNAFSVTAREGPSEPADAHDQPSRRRGSDGSSPRRAPPTRIAEAHPAARPYRRSMPAGSGRRRRSGDRTQPTCGAAPCTWRATSPDVVSGSSHRHLGAGGSPCSMVLLGTVVPFALVPSCRGTDPGPGIDRRYGRARPPPLLRGRCSAAPRPRSRSSAARSC